MRSLIMSTPVLLGVVACSAGTPVNLRVAVPAGATGAITASNTTEEVPTATAPDLVLMRVRLLFNEVKLKGAGGAAAPGGRGGGGGGADAADTGPLVVDLSGDELANGVAKDFSLGTVTPGSYGVAEVEIEPLGSDRGQSLPDGAEFDDFKTENASIIVDGTWKGEAFRFLGHFKAEQGTGENVVVGVGEEVAIPVTINPNTWFVASDGTFLDPTDAVTHDTVAVSICKQLDLEGGGQSTAGHCIE